jgi:hypothetical protein
VYAFQDPPLCSSTEGGSTQLDMGRKEQDDLEYPSHLPSLKLAPPPYPRPCLSLSFLCAEGRGFAFMLLRGGCEANICKRQQKA